jgi:hypothetical protein
LLLVSSGPYGLCYQPVVGVVAVAVAVALLDGEDDGDEEGLDDGEELGGAELDGGGVGFFGGCDAGGFLGLAEAVWDGASELWLLCEEVGDPGPLLTAAEPAGVVAFWSEV